MTFAPLTVRHDGAAIACRDHAKPGTTAPALVLMHGAGMTQASLEPLIAELADEFRVITFDFRGHGQTTMGAWSFDSAVGDLAAVIGAYALTNPAIGGHSLGGMVAAIYATKFPESGPVINLDGHGMGNPSQYVGKDPVAAALWIAGVQKRSDRVMKMLRLFRPFLRGRLAHPDAVAAITREVDALDLMRVYRDVPGALQVFNAYAPPTGLASRLLKSSDGMLVAYREGLRRDLTALAESDSRKEYVGINASHMLIRSHPAETAALMSGFLRSRSRRPA